MADAIVVFVTCGSEEEAAAIARAAVEERLAACATLVRGVDSTFRWKGEIHRETEHLLILKTRRELFEWLKMRVREIHSYETPEIIALPVEAGLAEYVQWIEDETALP
jgi:periplasmic divalent cation tolerance protein